MSAQNLADTQRLVAEFTRSIGCSLVDWFPMLAKLPVCLQPWRTYWEKIGQFHYKVYRAWWDPVKKQIDEGTAPPSFARMAFSVQKRNSPEVSKMPCILLCS